MEVPEDLVMLELSDQDQLWLELDNSLTGSCSECSFLAVKSFLEAVGSLGAVTQQVDICSLGGSLWVVV